MGPWKEAECKTGPTRLRSADSPSPLPLPRLALLGPLLPLLPLLLTGALWLSLETESGRSPSCSAESEEEPRDMPLPPSLLRLWSRSEGGEDSRSVALLVTSCTQGL